MCYNLTELYHVHPEAISHLVSLYDASNFIQSIYKRNLKDFGLELASILNSYLQPMKCCLEIAV